MRLVTWNCCRGPFAKKVPLLEVLAPDIVVIQECARPLVESPHCLWFGENPRQGVAIQASPQYRLEALPILPDAPRYLIPISVTGRLSSCCSPFGPKKLRPTATSERQPVPLIFTGT